MNHYPDGHNVGLGMVPHKKGCQCSDCRIERLEAKLAAKERELQQARGEAQMLQAHCPGINSCLRAACMQYNRCALKPSPASGEQINAAVGFVGPDGRGTANGANACVPDDPALLGLRGRDAAQRDAEILAKYVGKSLVEAGDAWNERALALQRIQRRALKGRK